jgi:hypothetical protein
VPLLVGWDKADSGGEIIRRRIIARAVTGFPFDFMLWSDREALSNFVIAGFIPATYSSDWEVSAPDIAMGPRNDPRIKSGDGDDS